MPDLEKEDWSKQRTPEDYLRKLMVEHFGTHPDDVAGLWQDGLTPPTCRSQKWLGYN